MYTCNIYEFICIYICTYTYSSYKLSFVACVVSICAKNDSKNRLSTGHRCITICVFVLLSTQYFFFVRICAFATETIVKITCLSDKPNRETKTENVFEPNRAPKTQARNDNKTIYTTIFSFHHFCSIRYICICII